MGPIYWLDPSSSFYPGLGSLFKKGWIRPCLALLSATGLKTKVKCILCQPCIPICEDGVHGIFTDWDRAETTICVRVTINCLYMQNKVFLFQSIWMRCLSVTDITLIKTETGENEFAWQCILVPLNKNSSRNLVI